MLRTLLALLGAALAAASGTLDELTSSELAGSADRRELARAKFGSFKAKVPMMRGGDGIGHHVEIESVAVRTDRV